MYRLTTDIIVPAPLDRVFAFFADAGNLEQLTPPWLRFRVLTPQPITMAEGVRIDYRLRLRGLPLRWQSEIAVWDPPHRFVDEQRRGPYRVWRHEHTFAASGGGTRVADRVQFAAWGGALVVRALVGPDLRRIFAYRHDRLVATFGGIAASGGSRVIVERLR